MKYHYTQRWRTYIGASGHILRFYFLKPDAKVDEMSPATRDSWMACERAMAKFDESEMDVLKAYFTTKWQKCGKLKPNIERIAAENGLTVAETQGIVDKAIRAVAIERGLADE